MSDLATGEGHADLPRGMKPGTPVVTTSFSLCLALIPSISLRASKGNTDMPKFSRARAAVRGVVSMAVPR